MVELEGVDEGVGHLPGGEGGYGEFVDGGGEAGVAVVEVVLAEGTAGLAAGGHCAEAGGAEEVVTGELKGGG